jgi:hypothetical protein
VRQRHAIVALGALVVSAFGGAATIDHMDATRHRGRYFLHADGTPRVYTRMEGCAMWHCMTLERTERLETKAPYWIKSTTLPEGSNFKYSTSEWVLERDGENTRMIYKLEMEPDFFVPPVLGPWYLKRTLAQGGLRAVTRIERLARDLDGRPNEPLPPLPARRE